ncbi:MAG: chromate resistance protein [Thermodesulfovibrionales bacterium]|nr:chromate resistance protein [Thermodesulfovibrionales bacterium]
MLKNKTDNDLSWLLFFYSLPSKPVRNRMTIWRKLLKAGALPFKGSVYIMPYTEEHHEFLTWLVSEVISLKGEGSFVRAEKTETNDNQKIISLFNKQRETAYQHILREIDEIERKLSSGASQDNKKLANQMRKSQRDFEDIKKIDFFFSKRGLEVGKRLDRIVITFNGLSGTETKKHTVAISPVRIEDYQDKTWATRERPFVDRFASAWLIKKFIDKNPSFSFIDEKNLDNMGKDVISFDTRGGRFTHLGDLCTFEVLMKSFALKDKTLRKIAEIVHELDLKDDKFKTSEAKGIEDILSGIRKTVKDDSESLIKGMAIFEMLYVSRA